MSLVTEFRDFVKVRMYLLWLPLVIISAQILLTLVFIFFAFVPKYIYPYIYTGYWSFLK